MADKKYKKLIKRGVKSPLGKVPFHKDAPVKRLLMQDRGTFPSLSKTSLGSNFRIAVHIIDKLPDDIPEYVDSHAHDCDEINLILSEKGKLAFHVVLEDEEYTVTSPATIYIPKGIKHKAWAKEGQGLFIAIIMCESYEASLISPSNCPAG